MALPLQIKYLVPELYGPDKQQTLKIRDGITVFVGPNGAGKTQVLRAIRRQLRSQLKGRTVRYISSGRLSPLEHFRADAEGQRSGEVSHRDDSWLGGAHLLKSRHMSESIIGDFLELKERPDLLLKVEARLSAFFGRSVYFVWEQRGLQTRFAQQKGNDVVQYPAGAEASGLVHLVCLLAAIYNDEYAALLIDEPEASLHPQLQAYILQELEKVAGDPDESSKKLIIIATQSPSMLRIIRPSDLIRLIYFTKHDIPPLQIEPTDPAVNNETVRRLLARMGVGHKLTFFCPKVALVEGPSDEIICNALAAQFDMSLGAAGVQIIPVGGKGEIPIVIKLFKTLRCECIILADLDNLTDDGQLTPLYYGDAKLDETAQQMQPDFRSFATSIRSDFNRQVDRHWEDVAEQAKQHRYWVERDQTKDERLAKRRATLASLLSNDEQSVRSWDNGNDWLSLRSRWTTLLDMLGTAGCFVLRRGTIEDYYRATPANRVREKPYAAVREADNFESDEMDYLRQQYSDVIEMLEYAGRMTKVDEMSVIGETLVAAASIALLHCKPKTTSAEVTQRVCQQLGNVAQLFKVDNVPVNDTTSHIRISLNSNLFSDLEGFPIEFKEGDNTVSLIKEKIKFKSNSTRNL